MNNMAKGLPQHKKIGLALIPRIDCKTRILILGSFPGEESLLKGEYYANKRNFFWRVLSEVLSVRPPRNYKAKIALLQDANIGLWDVVQSCYRQGALDKNILFPKLNDIEKALNSGKGIKAVYLNGQKAGHLFKKSFARFGMNYYVETLPSTSPANARVSFEEKVESWKRILEFL